MLIKLVKTTNTGKLFCKTHTLNDFILNDGIYYTLDAPAILCCRAVRYNPQEISQEKKYYLE